MATGFTRPITRRLPPEALGAPRCPTCNTPCGKDAVGDGQWYVTMSNDGLLFRKKGARKERFTIDWHGARDAAIRRGFATGDLRAALREKGKRRVVRFENTKEEEIAT